MRALPLSDSPSSEGGQSVVGPQITPLMPDSATTGAIEPGKWYISQAKVVPPEIISATEALVPIDANSGVRFISLGKILVCNQSIRARPSPMLLLRVIGR